ncbi:MAG: magnesium transporter [Clostridia bacterium]|nr:magnesium transporter [Clostridia bacterium]
MQETIKELIQYKMFKELRKYLQFKEPEDIAVALNALSHEDMILAYRLLPKEIASQVFVNLEPDFQEKLINLFSDKELKEVVNELFDDETVEIIEEMPSDVVDRILNQVDKEQRKTINKLLQYPDDSAGSMMTTEYMDFTEDMTVADALKHIREVGEDREDIYKGYILSKDKKLCGIVDAKELVLANGDTPIVNLMDESTVHIHTLDDQEEVGKLFGKYNETSLPVVDKDEHLVGIITLDDAIDVIKEEAEEDFEIMAAVTPNDDTYMKTSVLKHAKNRIIWLLILMISSAISGAIINHYENAFAAIPILVAFIPMIMDTGGNCGSQAATLIIRGLALDEIKTKDILKVLWKELRVSLGVGLILAICNGIRIYIQYKNLQLSIVVGITLILTAVMAKMLGGLLPIIAKKLKMDPAIMASPLITTIVDSASVFAFFSVAVAIMNI